MHTVATIDAAVVEYLQHQGLTRTADMLKEERQVHPGVNEATRRQAQIDAVMQAFDDGQCAATLELWDTTLDAQPPPRLSFYLHVYFAIYPQLKNIQQERAPGSLSSSMERFRQFLQEYSKRVDVPSECLPFYALPFVSDPMSHESFRHLFKASWLDDLRMDYLAFVEDNLKLAKVRTPLLITMFSRQQGQQPHQIAEIASYKQLAAHSGTSTSSRLLEEEGLDVLSLDTAGSSPSGKSSTFPVTNLDVGRISSVLCSPVFDVRKAELLQALRWNLTQPPTQSAKRAVLELYISQDLLHCAPKPPRDSIDPSSTDLLTCLLGPEEDLVKDGALRLLSAIANYYSGRSYLLQHSKLASLLCLCMTGAASPDTDIHLNALCILQKFSMRRGPETQMINLGVLEYLGRLLSDYKHLSEETIEFATALLFNLSLRTNCKIRIENSSVDMVALLVKLLEIDSPEVRHFVCGTFTSVLSRPKLKERAQRLGAGSAFIPKPNDTDDTRQQIRSVIEQLNSPVAIGALNANGTVDESWASDQEDEDPDYVSPQEEDETLAGQYEEDLDDELCGVTGTGLRGAKLLQVQYCVAPVNRELDYTNEPGKMWSTRSS
ncbi:LisH domain-containing protein ARMC9 [Plasmodiophora brassicae]|uniref:LisH domain-containing protein ARMC9 n=1 Tax=Plasmodiophora brassicae TaxID=37360 RepID=A0A0G4IJ23_PLABS|nr:hypothetical protein PBRA_003935 [Plasmodiophora brassicae]SPQ96384.1 unnamed protein product [Plasmodiophora brassicae]